MFLQLSKLSLFVEDKLVILMKYHNEFSGNIDIFK